MKKIYLALILGSGMLQSSFAQQCNLHPPANLFASGITACSATLHWSPYEGASKYKVKFKMANASSWSQPLNAGPDTVYTFNNLQPGKNYYLAVFSVCTDGTKSSLKKISITTSACSLPTNLSVVSSAAGTAKINLTMTCPPDTIYFRYALQGEPFTVGFTTNPDSILLTGLINDSAYIYQVSTCPPNVNNWTPVQSFIYHFNQPNIILILLDDSRYDLFSCNGAPAFFQTPGIDRIANEGVNFESNFSVYSLCSPSRASMATGMYPCKTHVISNLTNMDLNPALAITPELLHEEGYYTALLGKNEGIFDYNSHYFDYWFEWITGNDTKDQKGYLYNGDPQYVNGYLTDVLTDSLVGVIQKTDQPFFIWMGYTATHTSLVAKPEYLNIYDNYQVALKPDTVPYTMNYPSFLYSFNGKNYSVGDSLQELYRDTYEVMKDVDTSVSRLLKALQDAGKLENTMIIFTSDNGHLYGEHHIYMKRLAYDPSIRTALFIRYPAWFPAGSVLKKQITLNIDIAPTILEAAGINNTFNMDGISLRKLFTNQQTRKEMYYHSFYADENNYTDLPFSKAFRDFKYKYIYYGCQNDTTEEFFNIKDDPLEMNNLINNSSYGNIIQGYRNKLAAAELQYGDTSNETILNCYIAYPQPQKMNFDETSTINFTIHPNPSDGNIYIKLSPARNSTFEIRDMLGREIYSRMISDKDEELVIPGMPSGYYTAVLTEGGKHQTKKIIVQ